MVCQRQFASCSSGCHSDFNSDVSLMLFQLQLQMQCVHFAHNACQASVKQREGGRCAGGLGGEVSRFSPSPSCFWFVLVLSAGRSMWNARLGLEVLCLCVFGQLGCRVSTHCGIL